ncbi:MAG: beta-N-acetylhexosaminidase [Clostridia bacterium]|nr:beta-N-acetylhexosaminidase [Clostridia bacterium]
MKPQLLPCPRKLRRISGASRLDEATPVATQRSAALPPEGYALTLENDRVQITAADDAGEFYARQTLRQMIETCGGACDNLEIEDAPVLAYRAFHVDCCRHFYGVDDLKKLIEAAARFKLNVFHWHLTDDQGWRLEIKRYPRLTEVGATRPDSRFGGVIEGKPHSGYFTQAQVREIVAFCAARHIEVVPEIELPGHFTAAMAAYSFLGCTGAPVEIEMTAGIFPHVLCVGNPEAREFVRQVLDEVCALFPGRYLHIGGDEAPRAAWQGCAHCRERMEQRGLPSFDALQGDYIKELAAYLKEKGKTAITWNESLKGGQLGADDVLVQRWMERKPLTKPFAQAGGRVIEADFYHYYFDYPYGMTPLKKSFSFDPFKKTGAPTSVFGVEGCLWTEFVRSFNDLCEKLFPRLLAVAERGWSGFPTRSFPAFLEAVEAQRAPLAALGIPMRPRVDWDLPPHRRLPDIIRFFKGSLTPDLLRQGLFPDSGKKKEQ